MAQQGQEETKKIRDRYLRALKLERNYSPHTIAAYGHDISLLYAYCAAQGVDPLSPTLADLELFSQSIARSGRHATTQARILAGVRSFYAFLTREGYLAADPSQLLATPQRGSHLPTVLSVDEVDALEASVDLSRPDGHRNRAIIEVLFSCGLRVSELVNLKLSNIYPSERVLRVVGKGRKERLVPLSKTALRELDLWYACRQQMTIARGEEDYVFLNRRGRHLTRTMILIMLKRQALAAGITKTISPHTLRHSFATALLHGGADIRFIQALLGHEDIGTTERYTHIDNAMLREEILLHHPRNRRAADEE